MRPVRLSRPGTVGMNLDAGAVEAEAVRVLADRFLLPKRGEQLLERAAPAGRATSSRSPGRRVHRNKGTWRDMRSALIIIAHSPLPNRGQRRRFSVGFCTQWPVCARINMLDKFDLSDEKLRDALDSSH